jgi:RNA polymerase sigma factor (sigma-70 family)
MATQPKQNIIQAVKEYGKSLFYFIRGRVNSDEDAEDILQDVWYQFANFINTKPVEQTSAWLFRVARNRIIDNYRNRKPVEDIAEQDEDAPDSSGFGMSLPEADDLREFFREELFAALQEIPREQRDVFVWNEIEEIPFNKIAERTGENVNTLISRKRYAVLHLRKRLEPLYKEITEL